MLLSAGKIPSWRGFRADWHDDSRNMWVLSHFWIVEDQRQHLDCSSFYGIYYAYPPRRYHRWTRLELASDWVFSGARRSNRHYQCSRDSRNVSYLCEFACPKNLETKQDINASHHDHHEHERTCLIFKAKIAFHRTIHLRHGPLRPWPSRCAKDPSRICDSLRKNKIGNNFKVFSNCVTPLFLLQACRFGQQAVWFAG